MGRVDEFWLQLKKGQAGCHGPSNATATTASVAGRAPTMDTDSTSTGEESAGLEASMPRLIASLQDPQLKVRNGALDRIKAMVASGVDEEDGHVDAWLEAGLGKALLRKFEDPGASCRELAVTTFSNLLQASPQSVLALLPYVIPVLEERLVAHDPQGGPIKEPCEEVRLELSRLVTVLLKLGTTAVSAYVSEVVAMTRAMCDDPFHQINVEACSVVVALNESLGMRLQPAAKELVAMLLPLTTHSRHRVRLAAIKAVGRTMHQGAHEMILEMVAFRDPNVISVAAFFGDDLKINFCGKLSLDPCAEVRLAFLLVLGDWMLNLLERRDHEHRLLPYVVSALDDADPRVQAEAAHILDQLGVLFEQDHKQDLHEAESYLAADPGSVGALPDPWGCDRQAAAFFSEFSGQAPGEGQGRAWSGMPKGRPTLGARLLVQANLSRLVAPLLSELQAWQDEPRVRAARLLRAILVYAESASHQHAQAMLPVFTRVVLDPVIGAAVCDCVAILSAFSPPSLLFELLGKRLMPGEAGDELAPVVLMLAHLVRGAKAWGPEAADLLLPGLLAKMEGTPGLLACSDARVQASVKALLEQILNSFPGACTQHACQLTWVLLHLCHDHPWSSTTFVVQDRSPNEPLLGRLASVSGLHSEAHLIAAHRPALLLKFQEEQHSSPGLHVLFWLLVSVGHETASGRPGGACSALIQPWCAAAASTAIHILHECYEQLLQDEDLCNGMLSCLESMLLSCHDCSRREEQGTPPWEEQVSQRLLQVLVSNIPNDGAGYAQALRCLEVAIDKAFIPAKCLACLVEQACKSLVVGLESGDSRCRLQACQTSRSFCKCIAQPGKQADVDESSGPLLLLLDGLSRRMGDPLDIVRISAFGALTLAVDAVFSQHPGKQALEAIAAAARSVEQASAASGMDAFQEESSSWLKTLAQEGRAGHLPP